MQATSERNTQKVRTMMNLLPPAVCERSSCTTHDLPGRDGELKQKHLEERVNRARVEWFWRSRRSRWLFRAPPGQQTRMPMPSGLRSPLQIHQRYCTLHGAEYVCHGWVLGYVAQSKVL